MEDASLSSKAVSRSVTLPETFWDKVDEHAKKVAGDRSKYIRQLIEADLAGGGMLDSTATNFLDRLCERLVPALSDDLHRGLERHELLERQRILAANLVNGFVRYLQRREPKPLTRALLTDSPAFILGLDEAAILVGDSTARDRLADKLRDSVAELTAMSLVYMAARRENTSVSGFGYNVPEHSKDLRVAEESASATENKLAEAERLGREQQAAAKSERKARDAEQAS